MESLQESPNSLRIVICRFFFSDSLKLGVQGVFHGLMSLRGRFYSRVYLHIRLLRSRGHEFDKPPASS